MRSSRGFTLIEVVVAFAVAGIVVTLLSQVITAASRNAARVRDFEAALLVAESALDRAAFIPAEQSEGEDGRYAWVIDWSDFESSAADSADAGAELAPSMLMRVTVTVSWETGGGSRQQVAIERLMPRPAWAQDRADL